jgi:hypothetical protein
MLRDAARGLRLLLGVALVATVAAPRLASASDGIVEIDAARAAAGGVTPGDAPGLPVTLSLPGSYRLASGLVQADVAVAVLDVASDDVTIDFAGHAITGPVGCAGDPVTSCAPLGDGAAVSGATRSHVHVKNGSVRGTGRGILLGRGCHVSAMRVRATSGNGVECDGPGGVVRGTLVSGTGGAGFVIDRGVILESVGAGNQTEGFQLSHAVLARSAALRNASAGVTTTSGGNVLVDGRFGANGAAGARAGTHGVVLGASGVGNTFGVTVGDGSVLSRSAVRANTGSGGFVALRGSSVTRSLSTANTGASGFPDLGVVAECVWRGNGTPGQIRSPSLWTDAVATANPGAAIAVLLPSPTAFGRSVVVGNGGAEAQWTGNAVPVDPNVCGSDTTCP